MTILSLVARASELFGVSQSEITQCHARGQAAIARSAVVWAARRYEGCTHGRIGVFFGRDRSMSYQIGKRVEEKRAADPAFKALTDRMVG